MTPARRRRATSSGFGARGDLGIERGCLLLQIAERPGERREAGSCRFRQIGRGVLEVSNGRSL
jgi:hypothetical protein